MQQKSPLHSLRAEQGFTLIELLVVILIIGILAGIALPNFVSQRDRAFDATAKANVRNTLTHVEACFTKTETYAECVTVTDLGAGIGIALGTADGEVEVTANGVNGFTLNGRSKSGSSYRIVKTPGTWAVTRPCTVAPGKSDAGCKNNSW